MRKKILAADLFCGAGGTSQGLLMAANELHADLELIAINHWSVAIDTHSINHPYAEHLCTGLDQVDPRKLVPGGRLKIMCASPECTHHSNARGGKPMSDQSRSSAWHVLRFAEALYIDNIVIENVREFQSWGPLGANGRPLKSKRGQLFEQFINSLKALGYNVDWRVLNCADYGDPTTRHRLFILARRGGKPIKFPEPTHVRPEQLSSGNLFKESRPAWRTAREIIDWTIPGKSIFGRKKPLADTTLLRIEAGLRKFCGLDVDLRKCAAENLRPFIVVFRNHMDAISLDEPVPTVTTSGNHVGLVEPFLAQAGGPLGKGRNPRSVSEPLATVIGENHTAVIESFLLPHRNKDANASVDVPFHTVTATSNDFALCEAFAIQTDQTGGKGARARSIDRPLPTMVTKANLAVIDPYIVIVNHGDGDANRSRSIDDPMATVTGSMGEGVAEPFLVQYYGSSSYSSVDDPLPTATTKDRFGVVTVDGTKYQLDIRFRMLQPRELARAQGFPDTYKFSGNREAIVKQIGNAVPPNTAHALISEVLQ